MNLIASLRRLFDSISASRGVTSLAARNLPQDAMGRLAAALLKDPRCAAAMERLDLSSDSKLRLGDWGARELAKCLDVLPRLRVLNIEGDAPDDAS